MSQFDVDKQFEQLKDINEDMFTLPSDLPEPVEMPDDFGPDPKSFDPFDFGQAQKEARDAQRGMEGDESALLEAIRELPERIAEALRNG